MSKRNRNNKKPSSNNGANKPSQTDKQFGTNSTTNRGENSTDKKEEVSKEEITNDPAWYGRIPELLETSAHLNYSEPYGSDLDFRHSPISGVNFGAGSGAQYEAIPGVCALKVRNTEGSAEQLFDALNTAANSIYIHVRYNLSGRKNYEVPDIGIYLIKTADLYSFVNWAAKAYSLAFQYSVTNKYLGRAILEAMHIDADDLVANLANFNFWINQFIKRVTRFKVPSDLTFFERRISMFSDVYLENKDDNIRDQVYTYYPDGFYEFKLDANSRGMLQWKKIDYSTPLKTTDIMSLGETLLGDVWKDEDFGLMSGDIKKSFPNLFEISQVDTEPEFVMIYDELTLQQMKNATICYDLDYEVTNNGDGYYHTEGSQKFYVGNIYQDSVGNLWTKHSIPWSGSDMRGIYATQSKIMSQLSPEPGLGDNIESSRLMVGAKEHTSSDAPIRFNGSSDPQPWWEAICGANVVTEVTIVSAYTTDANLRSITFFDSILYSNFVNASDLTTYAGYMHSLAFKFAPMLFYFNASYSPSPNNKWVYTRSRPLSNIDNYTVVPNKAVEKMHDCALLSLLWCDGVAAPRR